MFPTRWSEDVFLFSLSNWDYDFERHKWSRFSLPDCFFFFNAFGEKVLEVPHVKQKNAGVSLLQLMNSLIAVKDNLYCVVAPVFSDSWSWGYKNALNVKMLQVFNTS